MATVRCPRLNVGLPAALLLFAAAPAWAGQYTSDDDLLPSPRYEDIDGSNYTYDGLDRRIRTNELNCASRFPPPPEQWIESFFDVQCKMEFWPDAGDPTISELWVGATQMELEGISLPPSGDTRSYSLEILSMTVSDPSNPDILIQESPSLPSFGTMTITDLPDGRFSVDSFFDVYTELSMDGGVTWAPCTVPMHWVGVPEPAMPGDANRDLLVNVQDLSILATNWNETGSPPWDHGNFNGDDIINVQDLSILATNWGWDGTGGAVPEPCALVPLSLGGLALLRKRRP